MLCTLQAAGLDELASISTVADMSPGAGNSTHTAKSNLAQASGQLFLSAQCTGSQAIKLMALSMQGAGDGQDLLKCKSQSQSQSQSHRAMARPDITGVPWLPSVSGSLQSHDSTVRHGGKCFRLVHDCLKLLATREELYISRKRGRGFCLPLLGCAN